jgi:orotate phosphoribosyltransferase-like protein
VGKYGNSNLIAPSGISADRALEIALAAMSKEPVEDVYEELVDEKVVDALDQLDDRIVALHARGLTDKQMADELPLSRTAITARRQRMELPAHHLREKPVHVKRTRKWWALMRTTVADMAQDGFTDRVIADELGLKVDFIRTVRKRDGIPLNPAQSTPRHQFRGEASFRANERLWDLWKQGMDDDRIADELGLKKEAVRIRRNRLGLVSHRAAHRPRSAENQQLAERVVDCNRRGLTDRQTAEELNIPIRKATDLRYQQHLPVNRARPIREL